MAGDPLGAVICRLLRRVSAAPAAGVSDAELLERFVGRRDEAAIETLLWRHGPMVWNVCRRTLGHEADSEDCFQAVFLILCRRAAGITRRQSLGSWLYKVAYRICLRARAARSRRPVCLLGVNEPPAPPSVSDVDRWDLRRVLDEELNRLPERYRAPLVLHYLEEKTAEQVALELGRRPGTVRSRLSRGKELLRLRLARRGLTLTTAATAAALTPPTATAALPQLLALSALQAVRTGSWTGAAAALAQDFFRRQLLSRLKWAVALVFALGTAAGAGTLIYRNAAEPDRLSDDAGSTPVAMAERPTAVDQNIDPLPPRATQRFGNARFRLADHALAVAYALDGRTFTTVGQFGLVHTWDAATGRPLGTFHQQEGTPVALSADGKLVAVYEPQVQPYAKGGGIRLRRVSDPGSSLFLAVPPEAEVIAITISADGKRVAAGIRSDSLLVWDAATGKQVRSLPAPGWSVLGSQLQVGLSPDGKLLAAFDSHPTIRLWDVESGEERKPLLNEGTLFNVFAFSSDGRIMACGDLAGQVSLWDPHSGELIRRFGARPNAASGENVDSAAQTNRRTPAAGSRAKSGPPRHTVNGVVRLAISSNAKLIACSCEGDLYAWDAAGQAGNRFPQVSLAGASDIALAFSPDNQFLVGCDNTSQIKVWRVATGRCILADSEVDLDRNKNLNCFAAVSPDDLTAATFSDGLIRFWDLRTGQKSGEIPAGDVEAKVNNPITFSADDKSLLRPYHAIRIADVLSGKAKNEKAWDLFPWPRPPGVNEIVLPDYGGQYNDFRVVRRMATGSVPISPRFGALRPIALSPDDKTVAWGNDKESVLVLSDWKTAKVIARVSCPGLCRSASFSPDGKRLAVAGISYVGLWDVSSGNQICELAKVSNEPYSGFIWTHRPLAFSPDGRFLAAADPDCNVRVWNVGTRKTAAVLKGHGGPILSLGFFSDSRRLISGSADSTALIWDVSHVTEGPDR
jgi:RNA polymerase sigma factor (sigma-70 family)